MSITKLPLTVEALASEPVLVAAWKKAEAYIRQHNSYADVLELDRTNSDLERVVQNISAEILSNRELQPNALRLVLSPKSQEWKVSKSSVWGPAGRVKAAGRLRPLAHATTRDQIISMAFLILFADTIETSLGDPCQTAENRSAFQTVSYGNRLMCNPVGPNLRFRWGSSTSYRKYFQDYQTFLSRPNAVVAENFKASNNWAIIHLDLSQFYDRVRPSVLHDKVLALCGNELEDGLRDRFRSFFNWCWTEDDISAAMEYGGAAKPVIEGFNAVALPQGLVASGFFANAVLIDFDQSVQAEIRAEYSNRRWNIIDYCRYVDDIRVVVRHEAGPERSARKRIQNSVCKFLTGKLQKQATGLTINLDKSEAIFGDTRPNGTRPVAAMVRRVAHNTSGVLDLFLAEETLDILDNLLPVAPDAPMKFGRGFQNTFPEVKPDIQEATIARFSAQRFRRVFRQSRPMCEDQPKGQSLSEDGMSRQYLDQKASFYSRRLVERWIRDPSNVRLLRACDKINVTF